ncbi:MAG: hypothetical protein HRT40_13155 [Campylobacteraceae bacterium]|nr:hypothetical protein [Campylobacteraceae bacterium]
MKVDINKYIHHLEKVCSDYCLNASDVYNILISKNDENFPLTFETVKYKVLKDVNINILKNIFTIEELKSILEDTKLKRIKNEEIREFINTLK